MKEEAAIKYMRDQMEFLKGHHFPPKEPYEIAIAAIVKGRYRKSQSGLNLEVVMTVQTVVHVAKESFMKW